ncbi:thap domain protein [Holotrichia oblita]|uniref:Thap domain protein n=1 Tax=Holotrichia oblita TaxID=644536 RepID=A0ACB9SQ17_HOLOL|nr:thap domain protein [Holotrichia oblita]
MLLDFQQGNRKHRRQSIFFRSVNFQGSLLEEDMENYVHFKLMGGTIIMRREVVPHIFECQPDRKRTATEGPARSLPMKRERKRLVAEAEAADEERVAGQPLALDAPSTSTAQIQEEVQQESENTLSKQKTIGVQVRPSFRSKYVDCKLTVAVQHSAVSPIRILCTDTATSPLKVKKAKTSLFQASSSSEKSFAESPSTSFASNISAASSDMYIDDKQEKEKQALNVTRSVIEQNPKFYLGVPNMWLPHLVDLLNGKTNLTKDNIYLTLMKIKLNDPFQRLGHMFGMSTGNASKIFAKTLAQLEPYLSTLIFWPPSEKIKYFLPIPFRARYHNVQSIIDCLEIEIEKPTNPVKQTLTWSEYKKCNTLKYLVSSTPDGFINFISIGYGGRISDSLLVYTCGYLDQIPAESSVMADRGFKVIAKYLHERKCTLVRPPSVSSSTKPTRAEVMESKRIASLRIHIERVIRRIREFKFLKPHSVINHDFIGQTDAVIKIACALINLQNPIIKQG